MAVQVAAAKVRGDPKYTQLIYQVARKSRKTPSQVKQEIINLSQS